MRKTLVTFERIDATISDATDLGLMHRTAENDALDGQVLVIDGKPVVNLGWSGYLGLEFDRRVIEGAVSAVRRYGVQFTSSRAYLSSPLYGELEAKLAEIVGMPVLVAPTTTLGHHSCMPVAMESGDLVVIDDAAHASMHQLIPMLRAQGATVERLPHSDLVRLRRLLKRARPEHGRIWYVIDGLYSMRGDFAPLPELMALVEEFPALHLYIDDAHSTSWLGERGSGFALRHTRLHPRTIVSLSMAKGFGAGGAFFVVADPELRQRILNCGSTMIFSGPIQNPVLGACVASAEIHLGPELSELQAQLWDRIDRTRALLEARGVTPASGGRSPIFFVKVGGDTKTLLFVRRLLDLGFYTNYAAWPAVGLGQAGIRFTITRNLSYEQIEAFVDALAQTLSI